MDDTKDNVISMDEDSDEFQKKYSYLTEEKAYRLKRQLEVFEYRKALKALNPDSEWDLCQIAMQEVETAHVINNPDRKPTASTKLIEQWTVYVKDKYADEPTTLDLVLKCVPSSQTLQQWHKRSGWSEAVWAHIRDKGLFTRERRASMIESLYISGLKGNMSAAKIYLTLSGDYSEKLDVKNDTTEKYREINTILHNKKLV